MMGLKIAGWLEKQVQILVPPPDGYVAFSTLLDTLNFSS